MKMAHHLRARGSLWFLLLGIGLLLDGLSACGDGGGTVDDSVDADRDGYSIRDGDCDDSNAAVHPGLTDVCNLIDDDCDGQVDEGLPLIPYYVDQDRDTYGDSLQVVMLCKPDSKLVDRAGDCDDQNDQIHPGASEQFDGVDNDCNGVTDDLASGVWYRDADQDGFGTSNDTSMESREGYVPTRGDCDDTDPAIHPGALDPADDGVDQDCGGTTGPEPHVGLGATSLSTIKAALQAAKAYTTIWVGPGDYKENGLTFDGKPVTLASTHFAPKTSIDGDTIATVFTFDSGEESDSVLDGFMITGAPATSNGAIYIELSSPTIRNLRVTRNPVTGIMIQSGNPLLLNLDLETNMGVDGGGIAAYKSDITIASSSFTRNRAAGRGGGVWATESTVIVDNSLFDGNLANDGGAVSGSSSTITMTRSMLSHNLSTQRGGAVSVYQSGFSLTDSQMEKNGAYSDGGAIFVDGSQLEMVRDELYENYGYYAGGVEISNSTATLSNVQLLGNLGVNTGGGLRIVCSQATIKQSTVVGNVSTLDGGGIYYYQCKDKGQLAVDSSILYENASSAIFTGLDDKAVMNLTVTNSLIFNSQSAVSNTAIPPEGNLFEDPQFMNFSPDRNPYNDDLHLRPGSPAWSAAGGPSSSGGANRVELGAYGGEEGDHSYYDDGDADSLYDGWERAHGLDPLTADGPADPDNDGLSNAEEQSSGSDPLEADTDGDGETDGAEVSGAGDPTDWFLRAGGKHSIGRVPADYPTVQAAVDAVRTSGEIELQPGIFNETLDVALKAVTLRGAGSDTTVIQGPLEGAVIVTVGATLVMEDLSVTGGFYSKDSEEEFANGAGLCVSGGSTTLNRVSLHDNTAANGGGVALWRATGALNDCHIYKNDSLSNGGGVTGYYSRLTVQGGEFAENSTYGAGGGIYADQTDLTMGDASIHDNSADSGAGIGASNSQFAGSGLDLFKNVARSSGGGLLVYYGTWALEASRVADNIGGQSGGGCGLYSAKGALKDVVVTGNSADAGAGIHSNYTTLTLANVVVGENTGKGVGGMDLTHETVQISNLWVHSNVGNDIAQGMSFDEVTGDVTGLELTGNQGDAPCAFKLWSSSPHLAGVVAAANQRAGMILDGNSAPNMINSIVAYNPFGNLAVGDNQSVVTIPLSYCDFYNLPGLPNVYVATSSTTNQQLEPQFLHYDSSGMPVDFHLAKGSPLVDIGAPGVFDPDGTKADLGLYGGPLGDAWDRDQDQVFDYFWPGELNDVPKGVDKGDYDENDNDSTRP